MDYEFSNKAPMPSKHTDEADIVISYMDTPGDHDYGQYTFSRYILATVENINDREVIVDLNVADNVNGGIFAMGVITEDFIGGEMVEFNDQIRVDRSVVDSRIVEASKFTRPVEDRVVPEIKEWSEETEFKSEPKPISEEAQLDR